MKNVINLHERLTEHFVLPEFLASHTAEGHKIPTIPLKRHIDRLRNLAVRCLEPTRQRFKLPILVTSGYLCPKLDQLVGGVPHSQHVQGMTADTQIPRRHWPFSVTTEEQMARILWYWMKDNLPDYDQLILEHHGASWWVHVSCHINLRMNRRQAFELKKK